MKDTPKLAIVNVMAKIINELINAYNHLRTRIKFVIDVDERYI